ncbi:hypothetical protein B7486_01955 [cyanobacterium TDX16]|nr:hypothetical protein B7486_01955 [cyanobacterium TDX16]
MIRLLFKVSGRAHRGLMALSKKPRQSGGLGQAQRTGHSGKWWVPSGETIFCLTGPAAALSAHQQGRAAGLARKGRDEALMTRHDGSSKRSPMHATGAKRMTGVWMRTR